MWKWEVQLIEGETSQLFVVTSVQSFHTIDAANLNLSWHIEAGAFEKGLPDGDYALIDVIYKLEAERS